MVSSVEYTKNAFSGPTPKQLQQQKEAKEKGGLTEKGIREYYTGRSGGGSYKTEQIVADEELIQKVKDVSAKRTEELAKQKEALRKKDTQKLNSTRDQRYSYVPDYDVKTSEQLEFSAPYRQYADQQSYITGKSLHQNIEQYKDSTRPEPVKEVPSTVKGYMTKYKVTKVIPEGSINKPSYKGEINKQPIQETISQAVPKQYTEPIPKYNVLYSPDTKRQTTQVPYIKPTYEKYKPKEYAMIESAKNVPRYTITTGKDVKNLPYLREYQESEGNYVSDIFARGRAGLGMASETKVGRYALPILAASAGSAGLAQQITSRPIQTIKDIYITPFTRPIKTFLGLGEQLSTVRGASEFIGGAALLGGISKLGGKAGKVIKTTMKSKLPEIEVITPKDVIIDTTVKIPDKIKVKVGKYKSTADLVDVIDNDPNIFGQYNIITRKIEIKRGLEKSPNKFKSREILGDTKNEVIFHELGHDIDINYGKATKIINKLRKFDNDLNLKQETATYERIAGNYPSEQYNLEINADKIALASKLNLLGRTRVKEFATKTAPEKPVYDSFKSNIKVGEEFNIKSPAQSGDYITPPKYGQKTLFGEDLVIPKKELVGLRQTTTYSGKGIRTQTLPKAIRILDRKGTIVEIEGLDSTGLLTKRNGGYKTIGGRQTELIRRQKVYGEIGKGKTVEVTSANQLTRVGDETYFKTPKKWERIYDLRTEGKGVPKLPQRSFKSSELGVFEKKGNSGTVEKYGPASDVLGGPWKRIVEKQIVQPDGTIVVKQVQESVNMRGLGFQKQTPKIKLIETTKPSKAAKIGVESITKSTNKPYSGQALPLLVYSEQYQKPVTIQSPKSISAISMNIQSPKSVLTSRSIQIPKPEFKQSTPQKLTPSLTIKSTSKQLQPQVPVSISGINVNNDLIQSPNVKIAQMQSMDQIPVVDTVQIPKLALTQSPITNLFRNPKEPIKPKRIIPPTPEDKTISSKFGTFDNAQAYNAYIKSKLTKLAKGKYKSKGYTKVNTRPLTRKSAMGLSMAIAAKYANRSGYIKKATGKANKIIKYENDFNRLNNQFRPSKSNKNTFVEKSKYAIDTPEERKAIPYEAARQRKKASNIFKISKAKFM